MPLIVASYNVLADAYVTPERYPGVPLAALDFMVRGPSLLRRIAGLGADVICLQEVEPSLYVSLEGHLKTRGYIGHYARKGAGKPDGCATFIREAMAGDAVETLHYFDGGRPPKPTTGHLALLVRLRAENLTIGIANTHLKWDAPETPERSRLGLRQIIQLLRERDTALPGANAWIVCGDFNVTADNAVAEATRRAGLIDAYSGRDTAHTCLVDRAAKRIDYLFHTPNLRSAPADLPALDSQSVLPSADEPSDHVPIVVTLEAAPAV
jgi:mRNA deadenylase 3'-5' endonuclease subunit Ccr4